MPCFNEAGKIGDVLAEMPGSIDGYRVSLLVVDDGSTDDSVAEVGRALDRRPKPDPLDVRILPQSVNRGKGAALMRALDLVRFEPFDALVWMDSDGQHLPSYLPDLVRPILRHQADLCVGSRYLGASSCGSVPLNRRLVRLGSIRAIARITGFVSTDPFSGFRAFSRAGLGSVELRGRGYEAELESCFSIGRAQLRFQEVPIPRIYGPGTSKMGYQQGALRGRLKVLAGYARTISAARRQRPTLTVLPFRSSVH